MIAPDCTKCNYCSSMEEEKWSDPLGDYILVESCNAADGRVIDLADGEKHPDWCPLLDDSGEVDRYQMQTSAGFAETLYYDALRACDSPLTPERVLLILNQHQRLLVAIHFALTEDQDLGPFAGGTLENIIARCANESEEKTDMQ